MHYHEHYTPDAASAVQLCRLWSARVDALERHLDRMEPLTPAKATPTMAAPTKKKARRNRRGTNRGDNKGEMK